MVLPPQRGPNQAADMSRVLGVGLTWALSTVLFLFLGRYADGRFGTAPWLTLVGAVVGAVGGFYYMYYHLVIEPRERENRRGGSE